MPRWVSKMSRISIKDQLLKHIEIDKDGCWIWKGAKDKRGYGIVIINYKQRSAHRVSYEVFKGIIKNEIDHLCRKHSCINPDCLEDVTHQENMSRGIWPAKEFCPQGHSYSEENTMIRGNGAKVCKVCNQLRRKEWRTRTGRH